MVREVDHALDAGTQSQGAGLFRDNVKTKVNLNFSFRLSTNKTDSMESQTSYLLECDGLAVGNANLAGSSQRSVAAGEEEQLAPRVDQQRDLVVDLHQTAKKNEPINIRHSNRINHHFPVWHHV